MVAMGGRFQFRRWAQGSVTDDGDGQVVRQLQSPCDDGDLNSPPREGEYY